MKKLLSLLLAALLVSCACGAVAEGSKVTVWSTGSQNVADLFNELIQEFNASQDEYVAENQHILSGTGDEGLPARVCAAYLANQTNTDFDLICTAAADFQEYIDEAKTTDILMDLDTSKIEGYDTLVSHVSDHADKLIPYRATMVVFAYDSERIPEDELPKTWDELTEWIKNHPGRFAYNEPDSGGAGKSFVLSSVYRYMPDEAKTSSDPVWADQFGEGLQWLTEIHPYLYQSGGNVLYPNKNQGTLDLLINQEVDMIPAWADQLITNVTNGTLPDSTRMMQLDVPLTGTLECFGIPSFGSNPDGAHAFISFVISAVISSRCFLSSSSNSSLIPSTSDWE